MRKTTATPKGSGMKRIFLSFLVSLLSFAAQAQLYDVDIHVVINDKGNARICESRDANVTQGTEGYIKMYDLQGRDIGELAVSDETGREFERLDSWNVDGSFDDKAYKCGIYHAERGPELCWGISRYGHHTHNVRYTLTRLVKAYDDYDGFIFNFYEAAYPYAQHMHVTIEVENKNLTSDDTRVWSFKHYGTIYVTDGKIEVETIKPFQASGEMMTIMVQFNKGVVNPTTTVESTFYKAVKRKALRGSQYQDLENGDSCQSTISSLTGMSDTDSSVLDGIMWMLLLVLGPLILIMAPAISLEGCEHDKQMHRLFGNVKGEVTSWFREIPCDGNLGKTAGVYFKVNKRTDKNALRMAYILRMVYGKQLTIVQNAKDKKLKKSFLVAKPEESGDDYPHLLQQFLYDAAGEDHILDPNELKNYVRKDTVKIRSKAKKLDTALTKDTNIFIKNITPKSATEVFGFKKFLEDFTLSHERNIEDVALWKEYLVHATLFGIADQVRRDMKTVMPDFNELSGMDETLLDTDTNSMVLSLSTLANEAITYASNYMTPAEREAQRSRYDSGSSSGGGGYSSYSGGSGGGGGGGSGYR